MTSCWANKEVSSADSRLLSDFEIRISNFDSGPHIHQVQVHRARQYRAKITIKPGVGRPRSEQRGR